MVEVAKITDKWLGKESKVFNRFLIPVFKSRIVLKSTEKEILNVVVGPLGLISISKKGIEIFPLNGEENDLKNFVNEDQKASFKIGKLEQKVKESE